VHGGRRTARYAFSVQGVALPAGKMRGSLQTKLKAAANAVGPPPASMLDPAYGVDFVTGQ
jgi:hypothetical protein